MALPKIQDIRQLGDQELVDEIVKVKKELFDLRFRKATRQLDNGFHQFKHGQHRIAQLKTVLRERQLSQTLEAPKSTVAPS
ncbi:MAG: 50S ribosomal protein L29, partial [Cyanobacteria bacterium J06639_16]